MQYNNQNILLVYRVGIKSDIGYKMPRETRRRREGEGEEEKTDSKSTKWNNLRSSC